MLILEENFRRHLEAFASELLTYIIRKIKTTDSFFLFMTESNNLLYNLKRVKRCVKKL